MMEEPTTDSAELFEADGGNSKSVAVIQLSEIETDGEGGEDIHYCKKCQTAYTSIEAYLEHKVRHDNYKVKYQLWERDRHMVLPTLVQKKPKGRGAALQRRGALVGDPLSQQVQAMAPGEDRESQTSGQGAPHPPTKYRHPWIWSKGARDDLLKLYSDIRQQQMKIPWEQVASMYNRTHSQKVTGEQCRLKIKCEREKYDRAEKHNNTSGNSQREIEEILIDAFQPESMVTQTIDSESQKARGAELEKEGKEHREGNAESDGGRKNERKRKNGREKPEAKKPRSDVDKILAFLKSRHEEKSKFEEKKLALLQELVQAMKGGRGSGDSK